MKHKTLLIGLLVCAGAVVGCRTASDNRDFVIQRGNDNMYGVVSQPNGKVILLARFKNIEPLNGFFKVVNAGNYVGVYDGKGKCVLPCSFSSVNIYNNQFLVVQNRKTGLYDLKGKNIIPCEYNRIESFNGFFKVYRNSMQGIFSEDGRMIVPCEYDGINFESNHFIVSRRWKYGVISTKGKVVAPCEYDKLKNGGYGSFTAVKDNKSYQILLD